MRYNVRYNMRSIRATFESLISRDQFVRFTVYQPKSGRSVKVKAKIDTIYSDQLLGGWDITFRHVYFNRRKIFNVKFNLRSIRWITLPIRIEKARILLAHPARAIQRFARSVVDSYHFQQGGSR